MALIEVINDASTVLIDDNYSNACLATSGSLTLYNSGESISSGDSDYNQLSYTAQPGEYPQLVLELSSLRTAQIFTKRTGNVWTWYIACFKSDWGKRLNYYILSVPSVVQDANGLLQLFDSAGKLVFDSNLRYMKVHGIYNPGQNSNINAGFDPAKKYGVMAMKAGWARMHQRANPLEYAPPYTFLDQAISLMHQRSGTNILSATGIHYQGNTANDNPSSMNVNQLALLMILDVTNF